MASLEGIERTQIERKIEGVRIRQDFRFHLGASVIGKECKRDAWYGFRWVTDREITAKQHRLFNRGHSEELVVIEDLINAGCAVEGINIDRTIRKRFNTIFSHKLPKKKQKQANFAFGFGGGSCDGIIHNLPDGPKTPHLLEVKTSNTPKFHIMKAKGVILAQPMHYQQMQVYMRIFKLKRALYIMVCKETDERYYERVKYNPKVAKDLIQRAERIVKLDTPPPKISEKPDFYLCRWCDNKGVCHQGNLPTKNCRTCEHIIFQSDGEVGTMVCAFTNKPIKKKIHEKGCKKYQTGLCYV